MLSDWYSNMVNKVEQKHASMNTGAIATIANWFNHKVYATCSTELFTCFLEELQFADDEQ